MRRAFTHRVVLAGVLAFSMTALVGCAAEEPVSTPTTTATKTVPTATPTPTPTFNRSELSIDDPMSLWVVVNKLRPLNPQDFVASDLVPVNGVLNEFGQPLREPAARAVEQMHADAAAQGIVFGINSAYRDYGTQVSLYNRFVARDGQAVADTYSARPGHSEHQTGLAVDFDDGPACYLNACFGQTAAGLWLKDNAHKYGFIVRYPEGKESITGYTYEPWHFRYVGIPLATEMYVTGTQTLEEFFGLPAAPSY